MFLYQLRNNGDELEFIIREVEVSAQDIDSYNNVARIEGKAYEIDAPLIVGVRDVFLLSEERLSKDVACGKMLKAVLDSIDKALHSFSEAKNAWKTLEVV